MTAEEWRKGQIQKLQSCLHNLTFDVYLKVDGVTEVLKTFQSTPLHHKNSKKISDSYECLDDSARQLFHA